jgi:hypothetical protein
MSDYFLNKIYDSLLANKAPKTKSTFRTLSESYSLVCEQDDKQRLKNQDRMAFIIQKMKENPEIINSIYKKLVVVDEPLPKGKKGKEYKEDTFKTNPSYWLQKKFTEPEVDHLAAKGIYKQTLINALLNSQADTNEIEEFLKMYGKVSYIDTNRLLQEGRQPTSNFIKGYGSVSKELIMDVFRYAFGEKAGTRGPGEVSLSLLSPQITFATKGDLLVSGLPVEVKGQISLGSGGGRLKDSKDSFGEPLLQNEVYKEIPKNLPDRNRFILPSNMFTANPTPGTRRSGEASINILDHAQILNKILPGKNLGDKFMREMITKTYKFVPSSEYDRLFPGVDNMNRQQAFDAIARMSFFNYKQELLKKPEPFKHILFITPEESLFFNLDNLEQFIPQFKFSSIDFKDKINGPAVQVSLK